MHFLLQRWKLVEALQEVNRPRLLARRRARELAVVDLRGSVLVGLLWCVALLSLLVVGVLHAVSMELRVAKNYGDTIQAHYLALAGVEKAKAVLFHDAKERKTSKVNHSKSVYNAPDQFRDVVLGRGQFSVIRQGSSSDGQGLIYGVSDEESRLNVNRASSEELAKLPNIPPETVAAIIDYRDRDNSVTQGGAESEEYAALQPPYLPRNGPFRTLRELLLVRGISRQLLVGEDANFNGLLDDEEDDGTSSDPPDNRDGYLDAGWAGFLTIDSGTRNVNAAGEARVNVQNAEESALAAVEGLSTDIAKAIVQSRGENRLESIADLLEVRAPVPANQRRTPPPTSNQPAGRGGSGRTPTQAQGQGTPQTPPPQQPTGPPLIDEQLLITIGDDVTTQSSMEQPGLVNVNSASLEVLMCLPGLTRELAQAVINQRESSGYFANTAGLLKVTGITRAIFKQLAPRITARSETFRIMSEGTVKSSGARKRMQVVVRVGNYFVDTLYCREDDL